MNIFPLVAVGVSTVTVDSVVGINTGDTIAAAGLPNSGLTTVTAYNTLQMLLHILVFQLLVLPLVLR